MTDEKKDWAVLAADSMMLRRPTLTDKWSYDYGVVQKGFEHIFNRLGHKKYADYIVNNMDFFVEEDGSIKMYKPDEYNIDHVNNGKSILFAYNHTKQEKFKKAADLLRAQLKSHPRTKEGAFWHKQIYPHQIWLDGLYMGSPFYAQYIKEIEQSNDFDDVTKQFIVCYEHCKNENGLLHHAWDESKQQFWCDKNTGLSHHFWGRSIGWYVMALVDVLDYLPKDHKDRPRLVDMLQKTIEGMMAFCDKKDHVWYQIVNQSERKGNYKESSASCMMVYAMAKGVKYGYLDEKHYKPIVLKCFNAIIEEFVLITNEGLLNLNKVCQVAGLGGASKRDGSFAYYISEPIVTNDPKGYGAFLLAADAVYTL